MRQVYILIFVTIVFSCNGKERDEFIPNLIGIWQNEDKFLLIQDSIMINPFWDSPGFFHYSIDNDTLFIEDPNSDVNSGKIKSINPNEFYLTAINKENDIRRFKRISHPSFGKFESVRFESVSNEGRMPIFRMEISQNGRVTWVGKSYTVLEGQHQFQLDSLTMRQLNQLFENVGIRNYPKKELLPPAGNAELNLSIVYPDGDTIRIEKGLFEGKYYVIEKVFFRFETLLLDKKHLKITSDMTSGMK
jgi:hypothetical protein